VSKIRLMLGERVGTMAGLISQEGLTVQGLYHLCMERGIPRDVGIRLTGGHDATHVVPGSRGAAGRLHLVCVSGAQPLTPVELHGTWRPFGGSLLLGPGGMPLRYSLNTPWHIWLEEVG